jgi:hypothetical protein
MKKYTITAEEYGLMCEKLHSLENENSNLKGYIEGLEKQLTIPRVVSMCCDDKETALKNKIRLADIDRCAK